MQHKLILSIVLAFLLIALATTVSAASGCCCQGGNSQPNANTAQASAANCLPGYTFEELNAGELFNKVSCQDKCGGSVLTAPTGTSPVVSCTEGVQGPPASSFTVTPVAGERAFTLSYSFPCDIDHLTIKRIDTRTGTLEKEYADITERSQFVDSDNIRFDNDYTYSIIAHYSFEPSREGQEARARGTLGDIECWGQPSPRTFCISNAYYDNDDMEDYLNEHGYDGSTPWRDQLTGISKFGPNEISNAFHNTLNKAWTCTALNQLIAHSPQVQCGTGEQCIIRNGAPSCADTTQECSLLSQPFGLFTTQEECEGTTGSPNYCFYDRSQGPVNQCYSCDEARSCFDYKTSRACGADPCGVGTCSWEDTFPLLGIGVCKDTRFNNCNNCDSDPGGSTNRFNAFFDQCTPEKAAALSTTEHQCVYNVQTPSASTCDDTACTAFTEQQCGSQEIRLRGDNSISTGSNDPCKIGVCQWDDSQQLCRKNADGSNEPGNNWADCKRTSFAPNEREACEKDRFTPETSIVVSGNSTTEFLRIAIFDKTDGGPATEKAGTTGYTTHLCLKTATSPCNTASTFTEHTNGTKLYLHNLDLQLPKGNSLRLRDGQNVLVYYSTDNAGNPEELKELRFPACTSCSRPQVTDLAVSQGRNINGALYTRARRPEISAAFTAPVTIEAARLDQEGRITFLTPTRVSSRVWRLSPTEQLDGQYSFSIVGKDNNGKTGGTTTTLTYDGNAPSIISSSPNDGDKVDSSLSDLSIRFSEPITVDNFTLFGHVRLTAYTDILTIIPLQDKTVDPSIAEYSISQLGKGKHTALLSAQDYAGHLLTDAIIFYKEDPQNRVRLASPRFGIFNTNTFDIVVESHNPARCKFSYDNPTAPPATNDTFDNLHQDFDSTGGQREHIIQNFNFIPAGDLSTHRLHVLCKDDYGITRESFELRADITAPHIKQLFAFPNPIAEGDDDAQTQFTSIISIELSEDGFCKYSTTTSNYDNMEHNFGGFNVLPKKVHSQEITVFEERVHNYHIACEDKGGLTTATQDLNIAVDLNAAFKAQSLTKPYANSTRFTLAIGTNKNALCRYGNTASQTGLNEVMNNGAFLKHHIDTRSVSSPGNTTTFVQCELSDNSKSNILNVSVFVDNTAPNMERVDDSSSYANNSDISFFNDRLRISMNATDLESNVTAFEYKLEEQFSNNTLLPWTVTTRTDGNAFYVTGLSLIDGTDYLFTARAINRVGSTSQALASDGVNVNSSLRPAQCLDTITSGDETDSDCGGSCGPTCSIGQSCKIHNDCASFSCLNTTCTGGACTDGIQGLSETDIDCGGSCGQSCTNGQSCITNSDCRSGLCDNFICAGGTSCQDSKLSPGESDIDCGGSCPLGCSVGKTCNSDADCSLGLSCGVGNTCRAELDADNDGVNDENDNCPGTISSPVNKRGCAADQTFSCNDKIHDAWRVEHFKGISCTGDSAPTADPDNDGLSNNEEFTHGTHPLREDTDGDRWSDKKELDKGTDPLNANDKPLGALNVILIIVIVLLTLGGLGLGGYKAYQYVIAKEHRKKKRQVEAVHEQQENIRREEKRKSHTKSQKEKLERLKKIARKKNAQKDDYISLGSLRGKKKTTTTHKDSISEKLRKLKNKR